jgi:hypothetical protein
MRPRHVPVNIGGIPHLAKNERDVGHPSVDWWRGEKKHRVIFLDEV